jgi:hypothetical protein
MDVEAMGNLSINTVLEWRRKERKKQSLPFKAYRLLYEPAGLKIKTLHGD